MKPELAARLSHILKREAIQKNGVTPVTVVTERFGYVSKPLKLQQLLELRLENDKLGKSLKQPVTEPVTRVQDFDETEIEYRKSMAAGSVPDCYLDSWARLQIQKPGQVSEAEWRQALDDAGRFLDAWGNLATQFGWLPGQLFDEPRDDRTGGLIWFLAGETIRALGREQVVTQSGRVLDCMMTFEQE